MVRKTSRKRKAKVKTSPTRDRKRKNDENEEFVDEFVQSSDNERQANEIEIEIVEDTTDSFECANENGKFLCSICNQSFKYKTGLKKHKLRHKPPGGFICPECGEHFVTDAERLLHKQDIHRIFKCMICNEKCDSEIEFFDHINRLHNGRDREYLECDDCGAQFRQKNQLRLHCKSKCGTVRCFECNQCDAKFMTQNTLNAHYLIHKGDKPHLCKFCGNSFLSRGQLKIHERCHTKERPYKCLVCNKGFAHRESLVTHSSLHTGVKPYQCQCCGQKFSCVGNLIKHRRIRPQSCGLPTYTNAKCAPRASTKVPGSLTLKKEPLPKRDHSKRKVIAVPELLPERVELTKQTNEMGIEPVQIYLDSDEIEQEAMELLEPIDQSTMKNEYVEVVPETASERIEILEQKIISGPLNNALSYSIPKTSVLVLTTDGNYVITKLDDGDNKTDEIQISPPQVKEIIILNGNDLQLTNMGIDYQTVQQTVDDNTRKIEMLHETARTSPPLIEYIKTKEEDPIYDIADEPQYDNLIQHLEIVPVEDHIVKDEETTEILNDSGNLKTFKCDLCSRKFKQEKSLIKHMDTKHSIECDFVKDRFKCPFCNKQYSMQSLLNKHMECHGENGDLRYKCSCCVRYFDTKYKFQEHARNEHPDRLKCNYCDKVFKQVDCKTAHIRKVHMKMATKKYTFVCSKCGKKFNSHMALCDHEQADCGTTPLYKCQNCDKSLHSLGSWKIHQLIHTGDLPFSCSFCEKRFRTHGQVKVHERKHNGEKPFKCTEENCTKAFAHRESLLTHLTLHTGVKRFECQGCQGRFSCISNLQAHRRTHHDTCGQLPLDTRAKYTFNLDDGSVMVPQRSLMKM